MRKSNEKGFMLIETLLVSVFIASTLIFLYIQFQKVRNSYSNSFTYDTINGIYANKVILEYLQENGINNLSRTMQNTSVSYIDITDCPAAYLENTSYCNRIMSDLGVKRIYYVASDVTAFKDKMDSIGLSNKFKRYVNAMTGNVGVGYRLVTEFDDDTYASILVRSNTVDMITVSVLHDATYPWTQTNGIWQSGNYHGSNSTSSITYTFTVKSSAQMVFDWSVSSESASYDYLYYEIIKDGVTLSDTGTSTKIGGTSYGNAINSLTFDSVSRTLDAGSYQVKFTYRKDGSVDKDLDSGFVKNFFVK